jgi:hypothetical protein
MDDACMKTAVKYGLWLFITTWLVMLIFILSIKFIHAGITNLFLNFCCENGFNIVESFKAVFWLCIFNIILSFIFSMQTDSNK